MTYEATTFARSSEDTYERVLAGPRQVATLREGRDWAARNREMWRDALDASETGFGVIVTNGEIAVLIAHDRTWGSAGKETKKRIQS